VIDKSDRELLRAYVDEGSEAAFNEFARRHIDYVYSAAARMVVDRHFAEDITQRVFSAAARHARKLCHRSIHSGWLHRTTRNFAVMTIRAEERRRARENKAATMLDLDSGSNSLWDAMGPHLDHALDSLRAKDREILLLKFFDRKTARDIGSLLGATEEAAQKRITRALDRLRHALAARGVAVPAAALATTLALQAVQAAPAVLLPTVSATAAATTLGHTTVGLLELMTMAKTKTTIVAAFAIAAVTTPVILQHQENTRLRQELAALRNATPAPVQPLPAPASARLDVPAGVANVVTQRFDWRAVESADYREYIANLRAIGCPEETIRDIVGADLRKNLLEKLKVPQRMLVRPFWLDDERAAQAAMNETLGDRQQLLAEFAASHLQLLGTAPDSAATQTFFNSVLREGTFDSRETLTAGWSPELKQKLDAIETAHNEAVRQTGSTITTGWETAMERMALEQRREAALAEVLSSGDLTEYLLRESVTARTMRPGLREFRPTEDEFRKIFPLQREFNAQWGPYGDRPSDPSLLERYNRDREALLARIEQVLGPERFQNYRQATQARYQQQASVPASP